MEENMYMKTKTLFVSNNETQQQQPSCRPLSGQIITYKHPLIKVTTWQPCMEFNVCQNVLL